METTEKIVESYVRYLRNWFTIPNIKCEGQNEIDLLAIEVTKNGGLNRYHIESGISISKSYSVLTNKPFSEEELKVRVKKARQRRTLGYFALHKFSAPSVLARIKSFGFEGDNYQKIVVTWGWEDGVPEEAIKLGILLWDFKDILKEIADKSGTIRTYFTDDTMRTLQLMTMAMDYKSKPKGRKKAEGMEEMV